MSIYKVIVQRRENEKALKQAQAYLDREPRRDLLRKLKRSLKELFDDEDFGPGIKRCLKKNGEPWYFHKYAYTDSKDMPDHYYHIGTDRDGLKITVDGDHRRDSSEEFPFIADDKLWEKMEPVIIQWVDPIALGEFMLKKGLWIE